MSNETTHTEADKPSLTLREKLCYGIGDVSNGLALASVGIFYLKYLTDVAGLKPRYAGWPLIIGRVWDAVTDPLMGWITDHTKSRWGKRRPYLLFGAIPYALAFLSLWVVPAFDDQVAIFAYVTIALIIFNTCLTVVFVPYTSLTAAITTSSEERTTLTGYRMTSSQLAFFIGAVFPSTLIPWVAGKGGQDFLSEFAIDKFFYFWANQWERIGHALMALALAVLILASIWVAFWGTRERDSEDSPSVGKEPGPLDYASSILEELSGNRPYKLAVLILLITNCASTLVATMLPYYVEYVLGLKSSLPYIVALLFAHAIVSIPLLWTPITRKFGKAETYRLAMLAYSIVLCSLFVAEGDNPVLIYTLAALAGICNGAALMIPWAIVPDVVEYDELKKGRRREGLFYGGTTFSYKMATALAIFISSSALAMVGYEPATAQSPHVLLAIRTVIGPAPALLLILGCVMASRYPLTSERHQQIVQALRRRKADAAAK